MSWQWANKRERDAWSKMSLLGFYLYIGATIVFLVAGIYMTITNQSSGGMTQSMFGGGGTLQINGFTALLFAGLMILFGLVKRLKSNQKKGEEAEILDDEKKPSQEEIEEQKRILNEAEESVRRFPRK